jgi:APA family basic amino acid/polyamine antiporter
MSTAALKRRLGVGTATSVVVANMIGTGIFTTTGLMLARVESGWLVLGCWVAGGLIALAGALSYAELAAMMPRAGGEYVYLREVYGPRAAFLTGWTSFFVGFSAPMAASAVGCATYLIAAGLLPKTWLAEKGAALAVVAALTAVHCLSLRRGAAMQNLLTGLKLVLLGGLLVAGFFLGSGGGDFFSDALRLGSGSSSGEARPSQLGVALLWVMFAYSGWNGASYIAEEVAEPGRTLPRALLAGTVTVMSVYVLVNALFFYAVPVGELRGVIAVGEVAAEKLFGAGAATWLSGLIGLALLSSLSAYILLGPRVYFAMARDGLFFRAAARVDPERETPAGAIVAQSVCAAAMVLTGTFEQLLTYIGFALGIFPWMAVLGVVVLRRRAPARERPYRVWLYPVTPVFFLATMAAILGVALVNSPGTSLVAVATVLAGIPAYELTGGRKKL